jgi:hypothetical protein
MRPVNCIQASAVCREFLGAGLNNPQGRPIRLQTPYGLRLFTMQIVATVQRQRGLSTGHGQIDIGEYFGVQQRAMQLPLRIVYLVAFAQGIQVVPLPGMQAARDCQRINDRAVLRKRVHGCLEEGKFMVYETDIERRVMYDEFRATDERQEFPGDVCKTRLVDQEPVGYPVHFPGAGIDLAIRLDILMVGVSGDAPVHQFDAADFDYTVPVGWFETRGLGIKYDLPHRSSSRICHGYLNLPQ